MSDVLVVGSTLYVAAPLTDYAIHIVDAWHSRLADPTLADAILDRLVHNAHRLQITGDSMRMTRSPLTMSMASS